MVTAQKICLTDLLFNNYIVTMTIWEPELAARPGPRYLAIADALADDVGAGRLRPGTRLPTHRDLADTLGVTIGTVSRGYAEAAHRGLVSGEVGRGTFVRSAGTEHVSAREPLLGGVDLSVNHPPIGEEERRGEPLAKALAQLARRRDLAGLLAYPPDGGSAEHRAAGAAWITRAGLRASPEQVLVSSGSQHGMTAVFTALLRPGDLVLTEALTYPGMKALASLLHLRLQGLPMDEHGLRPDAFQAACRGGAPKALYCVPTLHNPTTAVMPETRRKEIAAIARAHGIAIVEDDVHARLHPDPPAPLASFAPELSCYLTGTAKNLAPGLRIGFLLAPPQLVPRIAAGIRATTWMAAPLMAEIAARWIADGTAEQIVRRKRVEAAARQRLARAVLGRFSYQAQETAYHLWLLLPEPWRSETFAEAARRRGVLVTPAQAFVVGRMATPHAVRVCLGAPAEREGVEKGLRVLAEILETTPDASLTVV
jgi:DNA-binding transcriptional MocR family regulator